MDEWMMMMIAMDFLLCNFHILPIFAECSIFNISVCVFVCWWIRFGILINRPITASCSTLWDSSFLCFFHFLLFFSISIKFPFVIHWLCSVSISIKLCCRFVSFSRWKSWFDSRKRKKNENRKKEMVKEMKKFKRQWQSV